MNPFSLRMPFGVHSGQPLQAIPVNYLLFLLSKPWLKPFLRSAIVDELMRREGVNQTKRQQQSISLEATNRSTLNPCSDETRTPQKQPDDA